MSDDNVLSFHKSYEVGITSYLKFKMAPNVKLENVVRFLTGYMVTMIDNDEFRAKLKQQFGLDIVEDGVSFELADDVDVDAFFADIELIDEDPEQDPEDR